MPTYDYECESCGYKTEIFERKITEPSVKVCPVCGKPTLRRLVGTGIGFIFKGSGFYITDYKKKEQKKPVRTETEKNTSHAAKQSCLDTKSNKEVPTKIASTIKK